MRKELVAGGYRCQHLRRDAAEADRLAAYEGMQRTGRSHVRRPEQDQLAHARRPVQRDELVAAALQHVDGAVAQVIPGDEPAHAVGDDIYLELRVAVVTADRVDERLELARMDDVVLPPVVGKHVETALTRLRAGSRRRADVAAEALQRVDDRAVDVVAEHRIREVISLDVVAADRERDGIEVDGEPAIIAP